MLNEEYEKTMESLLSTIRGKADAKEIMMLAGAVENLAHAKNTLG